MRWQVLISEIPIKIKNYGRNIISYTSQHSISNCLQWEFLRWYREDQHVYMYVGPQEPDYDGFKYYDIAYTRLYLTRKEALDDLVSYLVQLPETSPAAEDNWVTA